VTFALFASTLGHGFVNWDDGAYVTANPFFHPITRDGILQLVTRFYYYAYIPATLLSHAMDVALWGFQPGGHHLTNVLLHTANAALVLAVGLALLRPRVDGASLAGFSLAALLFSTHPLRAQSVSWISDRKDLLCVFFLLPSLLAYLEYTRRRGTDARRWYAASFLLFALAALSKSVAIAFPILLLLIDGLWLRRARDPRGRTRLLLEKIPFLVLSAILVLTSLGHAMNPKRPYALTNLTGPESILVRFHTLAFPIEKTFAPLGLGPIYPRIGMAWMAASFALVLGITLLCVWSWWKGRSAPALAWASYLLFLMPNLAGLSSGMEPVADRYSYLPSITVALLAGGGLTMALRRGGAWRATAGAVGIALVLLLSRLTLAQTARWKSSIHLWESVVAGAPPRPDYEDAYVNLGAAYAEAGRPVEARRALERAVAIDPNNAAALYNLGVMRYAAGEKESAAESFRRATRADPTDARAFYNLAIVLDELGHAEESMAAMKESARLGNPEAIEALSAPSSRP
jgi:tetratricopeptide (TPR) repeat protein